MKIEKIPAQYLLVKMGEFNFIIAPRPLKMFFSYFGDGQEEVLINEEVTQKLISLHDFESPLDEKTRSIIREYFPATIFHYGTISHGTMRNEDLLPTFLDELLYFENADEIEDFWEIYESSSPEELFDDEEGKELLGQIKNYLNEKMSHYVYELFDLLDNHAPPGFYFGAHLGDGSDYGFWLNEDTRIICAETNEILADSSYKQPETIIYWESCLLGEFPWEFSQ